MPNYCVVAGGGHRLNARQALFNRFVVLLT